MQESRRLAKLSWPTYYNICFCLPLGKLTAMSDQVSISSVKSRQQSHLTIEQYLIAKHMFDLRAAL